jgi:hypothetical protein
MLKQKNVKEWKTTVLGIISAVLVIAGLLWPEQVDEQTQETITTAVDEILTGVGALIPIIIAIFGAKDK